MGAVGCGQGEAVDARWVVSASLERLLEERDAQVDQLTEALKRVMRIALRDNPFMRDEDQAELRGARALLAEIGR